MSRMNGGNGGEKAGFLDGMTWVDLCWGFWFLVGAIAFFSTLIFNADPIYSVGIHVLTDKTQRVFFYLVVGFVGWINMKESPWDRAINLIIFTMFMLTLAGYSFAPSIDASEAEAKAREAGSKLKKDAEAAANTAVTKAQEYQPTPQQATADTGRVYYNVFKRNMSSGSNYNQCVGLLRAGNVTAYASSGCNTGLPLTQAAITTCNKYKAQGALTSNWALIGCGYEKPSWSAAWCNLGAGDKGQQRDAWCKR